MSREVFAPHLFMSHLQVHCTARGRLFAAGDVGEPGHGEVLKSLGQRELRRMYRTGATSTS